MDFQVRCGCGRAVAVTEGDAGARVTCSCGRTVTVPSLHKLRSQAGLDAYNLSPVLVLEQLQVAGRGEVIRRRPVHRLRHRDR